MYLAPLRLLALEAQEVLWTRGWTAASPPARRRTAGRGTPTCRHGEKLNLKQPYEVAVIDECQMIADRQRGYAWTRAILGGPGAGGPPVRRARGQGPAGAPHRKLRGQL